MKASQALDAFGDALLEDFTVPQKRVGFIASFATAMVLTRLRVRFIPAVALAVAAGFAAERLYIVIDDVHQAALGQQEYIRLAASKMVADAEHRED